MKKVEDVMGPEEIKKAMDRLATQAEMEMWKEAADALRRCTNGIEEVAKESDPHKKLDLAFALSEEMENLQSKMIDFGM